MIAETLRVYYFLYSQFYLYLFENISLFIVLFVTHILSFKVWIEVGKWVSNSSWGNYNELSVTPFIFKELSIIISWTIKGMLWILYERKLMCHKSQMNFVLYNSLPFLIYTEVSSSLFWLCILYYSAFLHSINTHCWLSNICVNTLEN